MFEIPLCSIAHIMHPSAVAGNFWFLENLGRVAISMVSARDGSAYALVLDAKTF